MALIDQQQPFNPDQIPAAIVGIAAELGSHDSGMHSHQRGQLLYAPQGCMRIVLNGQRYILPPTRAAWIPAGISHQVSMTNVVAYRSVYFAAELSRPLGGQVRIVRVSDLLRALIERMAWWPWQLDATPTANTVALFIEEMLLAEQEELQLTLPQHPRLAALIEHWHPLGDLPPSLTRLAQQFGSSGKTVSRLFKQQTGMSYQAWRQQWRLLAAIELLAQPGPVSDVAHQLNFSSDSAFIHFFRQHTGCTPHSFRERKTQR